MNNPIVAPTRRKSWTTYHLVEKIIHSLKHGEVPRSDAAEYLQALGVSTTRVTQLLNGDCRPC